MAFSLQNLLYLSICLLLLISVANAQNCSDCFVHSRASYYPNSDAQGTDNGACGFGAFGATVNGGDVSTASELYRDGVGCGACYQVGKMHQQHTDFILSEHAFSKMAQTTDAAASLRSLGVVDIEYQRISCSYPGKNITFKIDESSNYPSYLAFAIYYQQGEKDITAVQLCETQNFTCKLLQRDHGAVWTSTSPPSGPLSIRMLFSDGDYADDTWVVPVNNIPQDWKSEAIYDSGVQVS
uniref:Expansin-like B1 n=1 Tax=Chenopodium quinoa TaxID=63459 RepID=A0A803LU87_CHEQI